MSWLRGLRQAPVTCAFIAFNIVIYALMALASGHVASFDSPTLAAAGASVTGAGLELSRWRWLTAAFIHANLLHIGMNMWVLGQIGVLSEQALGPGLYALGYVATGVLGNVLSTVMADSHGVARVSAGASGAIMGLIGMAATFAWRTGQRRAAKVLAFNILFVLGVGLSLSAGGIGLIDNAAHIGGLGAGAVIGLGRVSIRGRVPRWANAVAIGLSFGLAVVAFAIVQLSGR